MLFSLPHLTHCHLHLSFLLGKVYRSFVSSCAFGALDHCTCAEKVGPLALACPQRQAAAASKPFIHSSEFLPETRKWANEDRGRSPGILAVQPDVVRTLLYSCSRHRPSVQYNGMQQVDSWNYHGERVNSSAKTIVQCIHCSKLLGVQQDFAYRGMTVPCCFM